MLDKLKYEIEKMSRRKSGFPLATLAYYGPDNLFASKAVVGVFLNEKQKDPEPLFKFFADQEDVRKDDKIQREIVEILKKHQIHRLGKMDRIFGCPHEEGIDYPDGEVCPQCPYWATHDRYTGEVIKQEV